MVQVALLAFRMAVMLSKALFKVLRFTGLGVFFIMILFVAPKLQNLPSGLLREFLGIFVLFFMIPVPVYILINNVLRFAKTDPEYSLLKTVLANREEKELKGTGSKGLKSLAPEGFIFGKQGSRYVTKAESEDGHIAVLGGAGSGKSSCIAIPSLISWQSTIFAIDIKGELAEKTADKRSLQGHTVKIMNPLDPDSYGFDPFFILKNSRNLIQDVKEIVQAIVPVSIGEKDPFWTESSQNILSAALLFGYENHLSFTESIELLQTTTLPTFFELLEEKGSPQANMFITQLKGLKEETLSSVGQTLSNRIMVFVSDSDIIDTLNRDIEITPTDLDFGIDVFIQIPEDKIEQWQSFLTLVVNSFLKSFERRNENELKANPNPILFLLDEFPRLGKVQAITNGLATLRSKQITIALFMQSMAQLDLIYGKETRQVIFDNCQYKAILRATDQETQEYLSKLVGTYERVKKSQSTNFGALIPDRKGSGISKTTEERRKIKSEDFGSLKDIVLLTPSGFTRVNKTPYYEDSNFK